MKIIRVIIALFITLILLYVARTNSRGEPEQVSGSDGAFTYAMTTVPKITEYESDTVTVTVKGPEETPYRVIFRTSQPNHAPADVLEEYASIPMHLKPGAPDEYFVVADAGKRGGRFYYYYEVVDTAGAPLAFFTQSDGSAFFLRYIGAIPPVALGLHLLFIFSTVFCVAMATVHAFRVVVGGGEVRLMMRYLLWATLFCFIGGYPFGIPMNYYAFTGDWATSWEGVPFGTDATDNKTQLLFLYLLFTTLAGLGTLTRHRVAHDIFRPRTLGWLGLFTFIVMLFIYLIPHSIQFSATFTYAFCYSWIGLLFLIYISAWIRSRTRERQANA